MCDYVGCKNKSKYNLISKSKRNVKSIQVCEKHIPKWAKQTDELSTMGRTETTHYILKDI